MVTAGMSWAVWVGTRSGGGEWPEAATGFPATVPPTFRWKAAGQHPAAAIVPVGARSLAHQAGPRGPPAAISAAVLTVAVLVGAA